MEVRAHAIAKGEKVTKYSHNKRVPDYPGFGLCKECVFVCICAAVPQMLSRQ